VGIWNKILFIVFLLALKLSDAIGQSDWKLKNDKYGLKIYESIVPDSKIKAVKVECYLNVTISTGSLANGREFVS
jgi:hypothetical protein